MLEVYILDKFDFNNFFNSSFSMFSNLTNNLKETIYKSIYELENVPKEIAEYYIVDKVVDNFAICEKSNTDNMITISLEDIATNIKEGDCLVFNNGKYELNKELANERENIIEEKMDRLFKNKT